MKLERRESSTKYSVSMDDLRGSYTGRDPSNPSADEPDDAVVYTLHLPPDVKGKRPATERVNDLHAIAARILSYVARFTADYVWQKGAFGLTVVASSDESGSQNALIDV